MRLTPDEKAALRETVAEARTWAGEMERSAYALRDLGDECEEVAAGNRKVAKTLRCLADVVEAHILDATGAAPDSGAMQEGAKESDS